MVFEFFEVVDEFLGFETKCLTCFNSYYKVRWEVNLDMGSDLCSGRVTCNSFNSSYAVDNVNWEMVQIVAHSTPTRLMFIQFNF